DLSLRAGDNGAEVTAFTFDSKAATVKAKGSVSDWHNPNYDFDVQAKAALAEMANILTPDTKVDGDVEFKGKIADIAAAYQIGGNLTGHAVEISGAQLKEVSATDIIIKPENSKLTFTSKDIRSQSTVVSKIRVANLSIENIHGEMDKDLIRANST